MRKNLLRTQLRRLRVESLETRHMLAMDLEAGLVGHWPLNTNSSGAATDITSTANNGVLLRGATLQDSGKIRGSASFDGLDDAISIPSGPAYNALTAPFSVSVWLASTSTSGTIVGRGPSNLDHWALRLIDGKPQFQFTPGGPVLSVRGPTAVADGQWHHLVAVRYATHSLRLYVDGQQVADYETTGPFTSIDLATPITVGSGSFGAMSGFVDDLRYYARALSTSDAQSLFQLGSSVIAKNDDYAVISGETLVVTPGRGVSANDGRSDEVPSTAQIKTNPTSGVVTLSQDGGFTYQPALGFVGNDSFEYYADDGRGIPQVATAQIRVINQADIDSLRSRIGREAMDIVYDAGDQEIQQWLDGITTNGSFSDLTYTPASNDLAVGLMIHAGRLSSITKSTLTAGSTWYQSPDVAAKSCVVMGLPG